MNILRPLSSTAEDIITVVSEIQARLEFAARILISGLDTSQEEWDYDEDIINSSYLLDSHYPDASFVELDNTNTNFKMITEGPNLELDVTPNTGQTQSEDITL